MQLIDRINIRFNKKVVEAIMLFFFVVLITLLAWQSDDAYHAYVMAKNLVDGHGFVYNIGERVNASTCPLFTLVIALGYCLFRNMFLVSLLICISFSALAFRITIRDFCKSSFQVLAVSLVIILCLSFITYTTSGLENSMLFFLAAVFLKLYFKNENYGSRTLFILAVLISLIAMTRMDAVLMFIPMILYAYLARRDRVSFPKAVLIGVIGLLPFVLWELFSTFYYGFPFPNTFYVKLGSGIPKYEYFIRGWEYYYITLFNDPLVVLIPSIAPLLALVSKKKPYIMCSTGVLIYLGYVFSIGGDFMLGRHFTVIFFVSVIALLWAINNSGFSVDICKLITCFGAVLLVLEILTMTALRPIVSAKLYPWGSIADERGFYFKYTSLIYNLDPLIHGDELLLINKFSEMNYSVSELELSGYDGAVVPFAGGIIVYQNSDMYLSDKYCLGDPFLSKLPAVREENWRVGHIHRDIPTGYPTTIAYGENVIENESLREYYEVILLITRGPLFSEERIRAIIDINAGRYDYLIEAYCSTLDENNRQMSESGN